MGSLHDGGDCKDAIEYVYVRIWYNDFMEMMTPIQITENAAEQIQKLLQDAPEGSPGVRLSIKATGCSGNSYKMEYVESGDDLVKDDVFEQHGAQLHVPKIYSWMLFGTIVDYRVDEVGNARFMFENPNEVSRCGCGESFMVQPPQETEEENA